MTEKTDPSILTASLNLVHSRLPKQQIGQMTEIARNFALRSRHEPHVEMLVPTPANWNS